MLTWLIDCYFERQRGHEPAFVELAERKGHTVFAYRNDDVFGGEIDFSDFLAVRNRFSSTVIFRGGYSVVSRMEREIGGQPGGFVHEMNFLPEIYCKQYGDFAINKEFIITTYDKYMRNGPAFNCERYFIKPAIEAKLFNGIVMNIDDNIGDRHFHFHRSWKPPKPDDEVFIAPHVELGREWRFVIIDGRVVTGSQYRCAPGADPTEISEAALAFARSAASIWQPMPAFTLDVAEKSGGHGIVEINQFSMSGLYKCDQPQLLTR